jgi:hypothetical protein
MSSSRLAQASNQEGKVLLAIQACNESGRSSGAYAAGYAGPRRIGTAPDAVSPPYFLYLSYLYVEVVLSVQ